MLLFQKDSSVNEGHLKKASSFYLFNQIFFHLSFLHRTSRSEPTVGRLQPTHNVTLLAAKLMGGVGEG